MVSLLCHAICSCLASAKILEPTFVASCDVGRLLGGDSQRATMLFSMAFCQLHCCRLNKHLVGQLIFVATQQSLED